MILPENNAYGSNVIIEGALATIERLTGLDEHEIVTLSEAGIRTATDLWECVGGDLSHGISLLSIKCGLGEDRLVEILRLQGLRETRQRGGSWIGRNWLELALLTGLVLVLGLFLVSRSRGELAGLPPPLGRPEPQQEQVVVSAPNGLRAFHRIGEEDLTLVSTQLQTGSFQDVDDVVGRFTLQAIPVGATILDSHLSVPVEETVPMRILSLPVTSRQLAVIQVGQPAFVLLPPSQSEAIVASIAEPIEVIVLAVSTNDETGSIVVAVKEGDLLALAKWLGHPANIILSSGE